MSSVLVSNYFFTWIQSRNRKTVFVIHVIRIINFRLKFHMTRVTNFKMGWWCDKTECLRREGKFFFSSEQLEQLNVDTFGLLLCRFCKCLFNDRLSESCAEHSLQIRGFLGNNDCLVDVNALNQF